MAQYTYELRYGGFARMITSDEAVPLSKQIRLQKFPDDRSRDDEYSVWVVEDRKDEMRETWPGKLNSVTILTLRSLDPPPTPVGDIYREENDATATTQS